jgi:L-glutamine-phosphate cytidylyltransferase
VKVVILAAGKGSRLGDPNLPKPLTLLANGETILGAQLEKLKNFVSWDDILIVVGYHKEMIMEAFPEVCYVYNSQYASENTAGSLWKALKKTQEDVLWLNGDVVFHSSVLEKLLANKKTSMVVNVGKVGEEEVKYRTNSEGRILEVSKHTPDPEGEALGINFFMSKDMKRLRHHLGQCGEKDYFERGIEFAIQEGIAVWSTVIESSLCTEIDFPEDLERANQMIKHWKKVN